MLAWALHGECILTNPCVCVCRPGQRTGDDLEIIYDELLHIKALAHLSNTVSQLGCFSFKAKEHVFNSARNAREWLASFVFVFKTRGRNCHCQQSSYQCSGTQFYTQSVSCWQASLTWRSLLVCTYYSSVCCCFHAPCRESPLLLLLYSIRCSHIFQVNHMKPILAHNSILN